MAINFAVLGTGGIANNVLASAINDANGASLWSAYSRDQSRAAAFAERHGAAAPQAAYDDLDGLLADPDLNAVMIATPDKLHAEQAIKRLSGQTRACRWRRPSKTARPSTPVPPVYASASPTICVGTTVTVRRSTCCAPASLARSACVCNGLASTDASNWRAGRRCTGGATGVGTHCLDQIRWLLAHDGSEVAEMSPHHPRTLRRPPRRNRDTRLSLRNGATAELCSSVLFDAPKRMEVYATKGYIRFEDTLGPRRRSHRNPTRPDAIHYR